MSDSNSDTLREKLEEGEYTIEVKDTIRRGKKIALNKHGDRTLSKEENDQLRKYMDKYKDLIIEIEETGSNLEGFEKAWNLGKLMVTAKQKAQDEGEKFAFADLVPAISAFKFSSSLAYRYRLLYHMFPNGDYDPDFSHTTIAEMAQRADSPKDAKEPYERMISAEIRPTEKQVRAWGDSDPELYAIADAVVDRTANNHVEAVRNVCILHGLDPVPSDKEIQEALDSLG